jgi:hypothetical protein
MPDRAVWAARARGGLAHLLVCALAVFGLAACSTPTPYQAAVDDYGYRDQQLESNRYRVSFAGNTATSLETVQNYVLYRAAELTVANGYDYFRVVDRSTESRSGGVTPGRVGVGVGGVGGGSGSGVGIGLSTFFGSGYPEYYAVFMDVLMFKGEKPASDDTAYNAREVLRRLEPTLHRPPA